MRNPGKPLPMWTSTRTGMPVAPSRLADGMEASTAALPRTTDGSGRGDRPHDVWETVAGGGHGEGRRLGGGRTRGGPCETPAVRLVPSVIASIAVLAACGGLLGGCGDDSPPSTATFCSEVQE